jgi:protocatechuate 3,4-dioxygenase beta subunit
MRGRSERRRRARERASARAEELPSTLDLLQRLSLQKSLVARVEALDEPYRTTILLRFFEGLRPAEIAEHQGVPLATVKTRLRRGLERLRSQLGAGYGDDRNAWCVALAPLLRAPVGSIPLDLSGPLPTAGSAAFAQAATSAGAFAMSIKIPATAALVVLTAGAGLWWSSQGGQPVAPQPAAPTTTNAESLVSRPEPAAAIGTPRGSSKRQSMAPPSPVEEKEQPPVVAVQTVRGRVVDMQTTPVPGIPVRFESRDGDELSRTVTISNGAFELSSSADMGAGKLRASDDRMTTVLAALVHGGGPPQADQIVVVARRAPLAGIVVDTTGLAVADAVVRLSLPRDLRNRFETILDRSIEESWEVSTDPSGVFALMHGPLVEGLSLIVEKEGFSDVVHPLQGSDLALRIVMGEAQDPVISGRVLDPLGQPVDGAYVALGFAEDRTDRQGRFTIDVRTGEQMEGADTLRAVSPGYLPAELVKDAEAGWPATCELRLSGESLTISGRVLAFEGEPLEGIVVRLAEKTEFGVVLPYAEATFSTMGFIEDLVAGTDWRSEVKSDVHGRFTLPGLLPRAYTLEAFNQSDLSLARIEHVAAGELSVEIRMPDGLERSAVAGHVLGLDSTPIAGVQVRPYIVAATGDDEPAFVSGAVYGSATKTDARGAFHFESLVGESLGLQVWGGSAITMHHWPVPQGADLDSLEIRLPRRCHFRVQLRSASKPGYHFEILDASGERLPMIEGLGDVALHHTDMQLTDGRTSVLSVEETARTLVLYFGEEEVLREALKVSPDTIDVIEL